ncbi:hypothetical protein [Microbacterium abyssi]|uniref:hypothetical protein n=1 Tax=Microbacterium abyssi TaxID=2782166 RepID=UPI001888997D|nr:hypothetical protein [Microbacterium sp. A18JL241]
MRLHRFLTMSMVAALGSVSLSACFAAPDTRLEDASAAMKAVVAEQDQAVADLMDDPNGPTAGLAGDVEGATESVSIFDMTAAGLVSMCDGGDGAEGMMGLMLFLNYGLEDALAEGWAIACPGKPFPPQ